VTQGREVVIIERSGEVDVALITATDLESLFETAYLMRSPKNRKRLLSALSRAMKQSRNWNHI